MYPTNQMRLGAKSVDICMYIRAPIFFNKGKTKSGDAAF